MSTTYYVVEDEDNSPQKETDRHFIGGAPRIPAGEPLPACQLCNATMTFYIQLAFPRDHVWAGWSLAVFGCADCANEDTLIPEMLRVPLRGADIPDGFLTSYQNNFRFLAFSDDEATPRQYEHRVRFKRLELTSSKKGAMPGWKLNGVPDWLLEDEAPASYGGRFPMVFLLQLGGGYEFETVENAPRQMDVGLDGLPTLAERSSYQLFLGNVVYLFGTMDANPPMVYAITQVD